MKYVIMCGGYYEQWKTPKQLQIVNGEALVERTIRLLNANESNGLTLRTLWHRASTTQGKTKYRL